MAFFIRTARLLPAALCAGLLLGGCAAPSPPSVRLALDGPPLTLAARSETRTMSGLMDRGGMAGVGGIMLLDRNENLTCQGAMDNPADEKGRLHVDLACSDGTTLTFLLRNLGPDQGMGVGKSAETDEILVMFYHPCEDEAVRRLELLKKDIDDAMKKKNRQSRAEESAD